VRELHCNWGARAHVVASVGPVCVRARALEVNVCVCVSVCARACVCVRCAVVWWKRGEERVLPHGRSYVSCETPRRESRGGGALIALARRGLAASDSYSPFMCDVETGDRLRFQLGSCSWVDATLEDVHNDSQSSDGSTRCVRIKTTGRQG